MYTNKGNKALKRTVSSRQRKYKARQRIIQAKYYIFNTICTMFAIVMLASLYISVKWLNRATSEYTRGTLTIRAIYSDGKYRTIDGYLYEGDLLEDFDGISVDIVLDSNKTETREDDRFMYCITEKPGQLIY